MSPTTIDPIDALSLVERFTAAGLDHPIRTRITLMMLTNEEPLSPKMVTTAMAESYSDVTVGAVAYHFRWMRDRDLIRAVGTARRRGATETFYRPKLTLERLLEKAIPARNGKRPGRKPSIRRRPGPKPGTTT